jgi:hypothetical protein
MSSHEVWEWLNFKDHLVHVFIFWTKQKWHSQFQSMPNSMDANRQLHDACPALHSDLLSTCCLLMVTSLSNLTAHLSGKCALHTA